MADWAAFYADAAGAEDVAGVAGDVDGHADVVPLGHRDLGVVHGALVLEAAELEGEELGRGDPAAHVRQAPLDRLGVGDGPGEDHANLGVFKGSARCGRVIGAVSTRCTTRHQTTPEYECAVVAYRWHALFDREVRVHGRKNRLTREVLACTLTDGPERKAQEIPAWMLDAAACAAFELTGAPRVPLHVLRELNRLVEVSGIRSASDTVQDRPSCEVQPGGADEDCQSREIAHATRPVRTTQEAPDVAGAAKRDTQGDDPPTRGHAQGPCPARRKRRERA